ncbi:MAG: ZIP family metal transporter [Proteobacteria bacterium]|nr:ZIP family metal transporter [Pseudomonadota bacterium]
MDSLLLWIVAFTALGGIFSVAGAGLFLVLPRPLANRILPSLVSFAIGALLGAAFLGLLPHALENPYVTDSHDITFTVLIGLLLFFVLEKLVLWRHCHHADCEAHGTEHAHDHAHNNNQDKVAGKLILIGDAMHNLVDGVLIAGAFMVDEHLGIVTALAVIAHEIPQEVGDFAILLQGGMSRGRAFLFNALSSLTSIIGGVAAYFFLSGTERIVPYVLALAASSFIYIAVADLIPGLHKRVAASETAAQVTLIALGVTVIYFAHSTLH